MSADLRRLPGIRRLAADYIYDFPALSSFFAGNPFDPAAWRVAAARTLSREQDRTALAGIITAQQLRRGAPPAAVDAARRLEESTAVAVLTGQQAGLFGGPLYTLLKALTAIKLANRMSGELQAPVVPVFWIDAEDHDWDEVRTCTVLDEALIPRTLALPPASGDPVRIADRQLDDSIRPVLDELERLLPPTDFRDALLADLRAAYQPGAGVADAFARLLERVLGDRGLVVFDAGDAAAKPLVREVFVRELATAGETARRATAVGEALDARGYHAQVHPNTDAAALFYLERGRRAIRLSGGQLVVDDEMSTAADLLATAHARPERFSPNVLLRPIVQDTLFPTVCYVAGPNELAYLAQLGSVYEQFDVPMPLVYPRCTATLVDSGALRFLTRYNLPFDALQAQDEAALNELLAAQLPANVDEAFQDARSTVEAVMGRLIEAIPALDPTLEGAARSTLGRMQHDLQALHGKMIQAAKRRDETMRRQFTRTRALTFPNGQPQERTIAFVWFLNQYGPALVARLEETLPLEPGHWVLTI